tara:strand:- start:1044 stop:1253 length:210 start_codon:yes stop_codon:yes gene_type:complete
MEMLNKMCKWTDDYPVVVGASVLILGLSHFGYGMGLEGMLGGWVGTVVGTVGVVTGGCVLLNVFMNRGA